MMAQGSRMEEEYKDSIKFKVLKMLEAKKLLEAKVLANT
jgi:hypothetical protein